jgi:hypothetical protein
MAQRWMYGDEARDDGDEEVDDGDKAKDESKEAVYDGQFSHRF